MNKTLVTIARPICRLIAAILWQLVWLVPVWLLCWYGKMTLPLKIRSYFGMDQAQDRLASLEQFAEVMKNNSSLTNPTAILHYLSAQLAKFSAVTKLNTLEITSNLLQTLCLWGLNLLWILALVYALVRILRLYRSKSATHETAVAVARQLQPQLILLRQELDALHEEIQDLKKGNLIENRSVNTQGLKHE